MTTPATDDAAPPPEPPPKRHSVWLWVSAGLALVAVGLLIWAVNAQSDADAAEQRLESSQAEDAGALAAIGAVIDGLLEQLGATGEDLEQTEQDLQDATADAERATQEQADAQRAAEDAARQAESAADDVQAQAESAAEEAQAKADEAAASAAASEARAKTVTECAQAYVSALGDLFAGESVREQVAVVRERLDRVAADCDGVLSE